MSIKHNSGLDVAVFIIHVALKRNCFIYNDLSVYGNTVLGNKLTVHADGYNGTVQCKPLVDTSESSLAFYKYRGMRFALADDMWLMGQNYWG